MQAAEVARWHSKPSHPALRPVVEVEGHEEPIYALQPKQMECLRQTPLLWRGEPGQIQPTHIGYGGAAGGGKSHLSRAVACLMALSFPGSVTIIFRRTLPEIRDNHILPFLSETAKLREAGLYTWNKQEKTVYWSNGSVTRFGYLERDDHVFQYQGMQYDCMIFEESTHYSWFQVSWLTGNRLRANISGSIPFALYPSNPGNIGHAWYCRLFIERDYRGEERPESYTFVQAKLSDNPILMERDPDYINKLNTLPEPYRSQLRDGDFQTGTLTPLSCIRNSKHVIAPFEPPAHWTRFGALDWGYQHPWVFGEYCADEDGTVYKIRTVKGRHDPVHKIVEQIRAAGVKLERLTYIAGGLDLWHVRRAYGENTPTLAEQFAAEGIHQLVPANTDRVLGLQNLGAYLQWENVGPNGLEGDPALFFMDEPGNIECIDCLKGRVPDPKKPEDVLKTDADEFGQGGDDEYDETRYALASRPRRATSLAMDGDVSAWSPEALAKEAAEQKKGRSGIIHGPQGVRIQVAHPEFGDVL